MVEINNKTDAQFVFYPKTQNEHQGPYTLHIHSELSQKDWYFEDVDDKASLHDYYKFLLDYKSVDDGEFNYYIIEDDEVMDTGLMRIGIGKAKVRGYDTPNEIIQYDMYAEPTERYEDKDVTITENGEYTITPDEGYNAIAQVNLTVEVSCDDAWQSGYTSGYTDGYNAGYDSGYTAGYMAGYEAGSEACGRDYLTVRNTSSQPTMVDITPSSVLEGTFEYRKTGGVWESITGYTRVVIENGEKVEFRGDNPQYSEDYSNNTNIRVIGGSAEVYGNVMSLIADAAEFPSGSDYNFCGLFQNSYSLTDASNLSLPSGLTQGCYQNMFKGCNTLTGTPELNATEIVQSCYEGMFEGCSSLTTAPDMPGQNLAKYSYKRMFANCGSLRNNIPASLPGDLAYYGSCYEMFLNCTSLTTAPALPATEIHGSAYMFMFRGCTSLTTAPELPATLLTSGPDDTGEDTTGITQYSGMFWDCTGLTTAPEILPATGKLPGSCYSHMFQGCTSLTTAPILPAEDQEAFAYGEMFRGCSSLNYVKCLSQNTNNTRDWLNGVAETGTFVKDANTTWQRGPSGIPVGWWVEDDGPTAKPLTLNITGPGDIKFHKSDAAAPDANINVYKNGEFVSNWQTSGTEVNSISVVAGDEVSFICGYNDGLLHALANNRQGPPSPEGSRYNGFSGSTATCTVDGKLLSILSSDWEDKESFAEYGQEEILHVCADLFRLFTGLTSAENLIVPADTMMYCYLHLFSGSGVQKSPVLRAAEPTDDSYSYMFSGCTEINYITCLLNNGNDTRYIVEGWLTTGKVPSTGTFVKKAGVVWEYGIPTGWTIIDAPEE